ncbi:MAG: general stress protein [Nitrospiraceae bacterium]
MANIPLPSIRAGQRHAVGLFPDLTSAKEAIAELYAAGFTEADIGLAVRSPSPIEPDPASTRAEEDVATGAMGGGLLGGLTGLLTAAGIVAVPGLGPLLAGGVIASALGVTGASIVAGTGIGAAAGGLMGGLIEMEISDTEAQRVDTAVREGRVLVTARTGGRLKMVNKIFTRHGADIADDR